MKKGRISHHNELLNILPMTAIDPAAPIVEIFRVIHRCYEKRDFRIATGQPEFDLVCQSALYLLNRAGVLNRAEFWDELTVPAYISDMVPEGRRSERWKKLKEASSLLRDKAATPEDLLKAMDVVDDAYRSLHLLFAFGEVGNDFEGVKAIHRYMCAALLKPVVDQLNRVWLPLRAQVTEKNAE